YSIASPSFMGASSEPHSLRESGEPDRLRSKRVGGAPSRVALEGEEAETGACRTSPEASQPRRATLASSRNFVRTQQTVLPPAARQQPASGWRNGRRGPRDYRELPAIEPTPRRSGIDSERTRERAAGFRGVPTGVQEDIGEGVSHLAWRPSHPQVVASR